MVSTRSPVRMAIEILLYRPELAVNAGNPQDLAGLDVAGADLLVDLLELLKAQPHLNAGAIIEHWRDTKEGRHLATLAQWTPAVPEGMGAEFSGTLRRLREQALEQRVERLLHKDKVEGLDAAEKDELRRLLPLAKGPVK